MDKYIQTLQDQGEIYFSGFYTEDISSIQQAAEEKGLTLENQLEKNNWVSLKFKKR